MVAGSHADAPSFHDEGTVLMPLRSTALHSNALMKPASQILSRQIINAVFLHDTGRSLASDSELVKACLCEPGSCRGIGQGADIHSLSILGEEGRFGEPQGIKLQRALLGQDLPLCQHKSGCCRPRASLLKIAFLRGSLMQPIVED